METWHPELKKKQKNKKSSELANNTDGAAGVKIWAHAPQAELMENACGNDTISVLHFKAL